MSAEIGASEREKHLEGTFVRTLPHDVHAAIAEHGIRNSHLTAIAPTGSISLLAGNVPSGIEPIFAASYRRSILDETGSALEFELTDYAVLLWRLLCHRDGNLPPALVGPGPPGQRPSRNAVRLAAAS
jgi:ribonucleoside-diphosphate reductase alpha chain